MASVATLSSSSQFRWAVSGWAFFIAENALLSENRTYLIEQLGDATYHAAYGTLSTAAMTSVGYAYFKKLPHSVTAVSTPAARFASWTCMSIGLFLVSQTAPSMQIPVTLHRSDSGNPSSSLSLQVRCPFDFSHNRDSTEAVRGVERISRHPGLWSFALIGLSNAAILPTGHPLQLWWLGPTAVAWLGGSHTDSRYRRAMGGTLDPLFDSQTSNIPFVAIITGRQGKLGTVLQKLADEVKPLNALLAVGLAAGVVLSRGRIKP